LSRPSPYAKDPSIRSSVVAWARLLRIPNLLTVPGDPLAGYLLAAGSGAVLDRSVALVMVIALLLYMAGLIMNDVADVKIDARERPQRPLPSGGVDEMVARLVAVTFITFALLLARYLGWAVVLVTLSLLVCLSTYNLFLKSTILGPLIMGLCRGLSLLLGAALVNLHHPLVLVSAGGLTLYIMAVTLMARGEMGEGRSTWVGSLPLVAVAGISIVLLQFSPVTGVMQGRLGLVLFLLFSLTGLVAWKWKEPVPAPPLVGLLISAVLILQVALCIAAQAGAPALGAGLVLLLFWPLNRWLARFVAAS
jgi:4-hydroxybenzoate polyprenyltransferase